MVVLRFNATTFLTCFCRGEKRKFAGKKSRLNRGLNSQPLGHESDTLTTEPPGRGMIIESGEHDLERLQNELRIWTITVKYITGVQHAKRDFRTFA